MGPVLQSGQRTFSRRRTSQLLGRPARPSAFRPLVRACLLFPTLVLLLSPLAALPQAAQTNADPGQPIELPENPQPTAHPALKPNPCITQTAAPVQQAQPISNGTPIPDSSNNLLAIAPAPCHSPETNWYIRFTDGPRDVPLTPMDKGWLAARNVVDPINAIAILGTSAIVIGSNPYSPYGPGMAGFGRNVGVAYAQDMTGEFFGTFLIPSLFHQNPHYRRLPHARFYRRLLNTCTQVLWAYSDSGHGMPNYANIIGFAIDDEIGNLYVPGRDTDLPSSAKRYALTFVLVPTDNLVSEFLPDVARRVNVHSVVLQRIINAATGVDRDIP